MAYGMGTSESNEALCCVPEVIWLYKFETLMQIAKNSFFVVISKQKTHFCLPIKVRFLLVAGVGFEARQSRATTVLTVRIVVHCRSHGSLRELLARRCQPSKKRYLIVFP
jgi:hypothetical protein